MDKINNVHDRMFKEVFKKPSNVRVLFQNVLPEALKSRLDFSTMEVDSTGYLSNEVKSCKP